jgi:hypothetical protein
VTDNWPKDVPVTSALYSQLVLSKRGRPHSFAGKRAPSAEQRTLRKRAAEADAKLRRLYDAIGNSVADPLRPDAQGSCERAEDGP